MKKLLLVLVASFGIVNCSQNLPKNVKYVLSLMQNFDQKRADEARDIFLEGKPINEFINLPGNFCFTAQDGKKYISKGRLYLRFQRTDQGGVIVQKQFNSCNEDKFDIIARLLNEEKITRVEYASSSMLNLCTLGVAAAAAAGVYCYLNPEKAEAAKTAVMDWTDTTARPAAQGMWNSFTNWASNTWTDLVNKLK